MYPKVYRNWTYFSFGHVLVCSPQSQRAAIVAPLQVQGELSQLLTWIQSQKRIFLPRFVIQNENEDHDFWLSICSLPRPLLDSRRTQQRLLHRVVYQVLPKKSEGSSPAERSLSTEFFKAEFHIEIPNPPSQLLSPEVGQAVENTYTATDIIITPKYWTGVDARLDLMLPNWFVYQASRSNFLPYSLFLLVRWIFASSPLN